MAFRKPQLPPRREREPDEYASFQPSRSSARVVGVIGIATMATPVPPKIDKRVRVRPDIRASANGEQCLVRLPGCTGAAIWSHNRHLRAGKGRGLKALDINGCYACPHCDAVYDGQAPMPHGVSIDELELAWYHAHDQSLVKLAQKGLL
jgi:hypothetical protein